jgi:hypothetical protein
MNVTGPGAGEPGDARPAEGKRAVRGTTSDNGPVKRVLVNGKEARAVAGNFAEWEAYAEDGAGNVEKRPHVVALGRGP